MSVKAEIIVEFAPSKKLDHVSTVLQEYVGLGVHCTVIRTFYHMKVHMKKSHEKTSDCLCKICHKKFKTDYSNERHMKK